MQFLLVISEKRDYSGLTFSKLFPVPGYAFGQPLHHALRCDSNASCDAFQRSIEIFTAQSNLSIVLETAFIRSGEVVLRSQYVPQVQLPEYDRVALVVKQRRVCARLPVRGPRVVDVVVALAGAEFELSFFAAADDELFCQSTDERLRRAMRELRGNAPEGDGHGAGGAPGGGALRCGGCGGTQAAAVVTVEWGKGYIMGN